MSVLAWKVTVPMQLEEQVVDRDPPLAVHVLLPVKDLTAAKRRLAPILAPHERRALVLTMLRDVIAAVHAGGLEVSVLSPDATVRACARAAGARAIPEQPPTGSLNAALHGAISRHYAEADAVLVILPDTPLVTPDEVATLVRALRSSAGCGVGSLAGGAVRRPAAVLAPDGSGRGTNALLCAPPDALPPRFGPDSLMRHRAAARQRGVASRVCQLPGLALDADGPEQLAALLRAPGNTRTQQLLRELRIDERIKFGAAGPGRNAG